MKTLLCLLLVLVAGSAQADYFLRFETSGTALPIGSILQTSGDAWLEVSIVENFPVDGPVHFRGDRTAAEVYYRAPYGNPLKDVNVNHTVFYVAEVPRSVTIKSRDSSTSIVITAGEPAETLNGAPSVLFEDGLLVTTALAFDVNTGNTAYTQTIYIGAAMPNLRTLNVSNATHGRNYAASEFPPSGFAVHTLGNKIGSSGSCDTGWQKGLVDGGTVEFWQGAPKHSAGGCMSVLVYVGKLSHVVRFE